MANEAEEMFQLDLLLIKNYDDRKTLMLAEGGWEEDEQGRIRMFAVNTNEMKCN